MQAATVLILTRQILGAGLLGALVEDANLLPLFPIAAERGDVALRRLSPAAVLLEGNHPAARSQEFWAAIDGAAISVIIFVPSRPWDDIATLVDRPGVVAFIDGTGAESIAGRIAAALDRLNGAIEEDGASSGS